MKNSLSNLALCAHHTYTQKARHSQNTDRKTKTTHITVHSATHVGSYIVSSTATQATPPPATLRIYVQCSLSEPVPEGRRCSTLGLRYGISILVTDKINYFRRTSPRYTGKKIRTVKFGWTLTSGCLTKNILISVTVCYVSVIQFSFNSCKVNAHEVWLSEALFLRR